MQKQISMTYTIMSLKEIVEDLRLNGTDKEFNFYKSLLEKMVTEKFLLDN